jgi:transcription initiation factor IIE alpha subunit
MALFACLELGNLSVFQLCDYICVFYFIFIPRKNNQTHNKFHRIVKGLRKKIVKQRKVADFFCLQECVTATSAVE